MEAKKEQQQQRQTRNLVFLTSSSPTPPLPPPSFEDLNFADLDEEEKKIRQKLAIYREHVKRCEQALDAIHQLRTAAIVSKLRKALKK